MSSNPPPFFLVGLDLGQARDYTALIILERLPDLNPATYHLRHLERFPLGLSYPDQIQRVTALLENPLLKDRAFILDATGVGRPVVDTVKAAGLRPIAITITGGEAVNRENWDTYRVPKRDLVATLQVLLQNQRLKIADALPQKDLLLKELLNFKAKITLAGHETFEGDAWREGAHDDLVLATALACWYGENSYYKIEFKAAGPCASNHGGGQIVSDGWGAIRSTARWNRRR